MCMRQSFRIPSRYLPETAGGRIPGSNFHVLQFGNHNPDKRDAGTSASFRGSLQVEIDTTSGVEQVTASQRDADGLILSTVALEGSGQVLRSISPLVRYLTFEHVAGDGRPVHINVHPLSTFNEVAIGDLPTTITWDGSFIGLAETLTADGTTSELVWSGGDGTLSATGTFGGGTVTLQVLPEGTDEWITATDSANAPLALSASGLISFSVGESKLRCVLTGATSPDLDVSIQSR